MIESVDSKGEFLTVENGNVCLHAKDPQSVQVVRQAPDLLCHCS